jgi:hypothetical protein
MTASARKPSISARYFKSTILSPDGFPQRGDATFANVNIDKRILGILRMPPYFLSLGHIVATACLQICF